MDRLWWANASGDETLTLFLIITNAVLGIFVLGCILLVVRTLIREILLRRRARSFSVTGLGVTMADGGQCGGPEGQLFVSKNGKIQPGRHDPQAQDH